MVILKTERLLLRPLGVNDLYSTHEYAGNEENAKYMMFLPNENLDETKKFLINASDEWAKSNPAFYEFAIITDGNRHIGAISIYLNESCSEGELGWIIHKDFWGNGYASEAAEAIKDFAINELKLKKLIAHCDSRNTASFRVMERIGMTLEKDDELRVNKSSCEPVKEYMYSLFTGL